MINLIALIKIEIKPDKICLLCIASYGLCEKFGSKKLLLNNQNYRFFLENNPLSWDLSFPAGNLYGRAHNIKKTEIKVFSHAFVAGYQDNFPKTFKNYLRIF
jgi:hypothetical protein